MGGRIPQKMAWDGGMVSPNEFLGVISSGKSQVRPWEMVQNIGFRCFPVDLARLRGMSDRFTHTSGKSIL